MQLLIRVRRLWRSRIEVRLSVSPKELDHADVISLPVIVVALVEQVRLVANRKDRGVPRF